MTLTNPTATRDGTPSGTYDAADRAVGNDRANAALDRAVEHLLGKQHQQGWWRGLLQTNVTMDAEDLLMRQFLGVRTPHQTQSSARWIRSQQRDDGSWANFSGGPADPSTTAEAYVALRLAGDLPDAPHMASARQVVLAHGGLAGTRAFTRIWLALFGEWDWDLVPTLPPEMVFLPRWVPLNLYDFACWARQTIAPLSVLSALRPQRDLGVCIDELHVEMPAAGGWSSLFTGLDRLLRRYQHLPRKPLRASALRRMEKWIVERREADGSWGGIQPPWVYSLMALHALGYSLEQPVLARGLAGWERFTVIEPSPDGPLRWIEACQSPVWDTALAVVALGDAGLCAEHPALSAAAAWLIGEEITVSGDWAVRRRGAPAGGWAFEFDNDRYPDIDDSAEVILALGRLRRREHPRGCLPAAVLRLRRGHRPAERRRHRERAGNAGRPRTGRHRRRAARRPPAARGPAGGWVVVRSVGANHIYGTGAAVPALVAAGVGPDTPAIRRAVDWLARKQNPDGGWGEDLRSYTDPTWVGRGTSTASQTAWALLALHAAGSTDAIGAKRGVQWLVSHQRPDGGWDEPEFTGTGFPGDFYINYHLYRLVFPISALGRCLGRSPEMMT